MDQFLCDILSLRRPHGSTLEQQFAEVLLNGLPDANADPFGNIIVETDPESRTLFSCHIDTVSKEPGRQAIAYEPPVVRLANGKPGMSLGADDGAGIWLMCHMILARKPGVYVFHRGEEVGGLGSNYIKNHNPGFLKRFDRAIAFDRRGKTDVITHQLGRRCASDDFAFALANQLPGYRPAEGIYTDTANYTEIIPECSNISVGYENEHGPLESLNADHLAWLLIRLFRIDFEQLPTVREPGVLPLFEHDQRLAKWIRENADELATAYEMQGLDQFDLECMIDEAWEQAA